MLKRIGFAAAAVLVIAGVLVGSFVLAPSLAPSPVLAGNSLQTSASSDQYAGIDVSGTGKVFVKPNIAISNIGVEVTSATLADATSQANAKMSAVISQIKSMGVDDKDIQTTNYSVQPLTDQSNTGGRTPKITGYRVDNQVSVTVRNLGNLGKILDAAVAAGANNIYGVSFSVDDPTSYQQQARAAAVKDAMDKGAQLAKAAGLTLGKIVWMTEGAPSPQPRVLAAPAAFAASANVPVETGQLEIDVSVQMRFAIQ